MEVTQERKRIRTILVGNGYFGSIYRKHLIGHDRYDLVGLVDDRTDRLTPDVPTHAMTQRHLLDNMDCDAVVICTPPDTHYALAEEALTMGKNVLLAKPGTMSFMDAALLHGVAKQHDAALVVDYTPLWAPEVNAIDQQIAMLGEPIQFNSSRRVSTPAKPEGIILDLLCHDAAIYQYLVQTTPDTVTCRVFNNNAVQAEVVSDRGIGVFYAEYEAKTPGKSCEFRLDTTSTGITNPGVKIHWNQMLRRVTVSSQSDRVGFHFLHRPDPITRLLDEFSEWTHDDAYRSVNEMRHLWVMHLLQAMQQSANEGGAEVDL